jgi:hypothetical protein
MNWGGVGIGVLMWQQTATQNAKSGGTYEVHSDQWPPGRLDSGVIGRHAREVDTPIKRPLRGIMDKRDHTQAAVPWPNG